MGWGGLTEKEIVALFKIVQQNQTSIYIDGNAIIAKNRLNGEIARGIKGTDDTDVINAALADSEGIVRFGKGTFQPDDVLNLTGNFRYLSGEGENQTIIDYQGSGTVFQYAPASQQVPFTKISDMTIQGTTGGACVYLAKSTVNFLENLRLEACKYGVILDDCPETVINRCYFGANQSATPVDIEVYRSSALRIHQCSINGDVSKTKGIRMNELASSKVLIDACVFQQLAQGLRMEKTTSGNHNTTTVKDSFFESCTAPFIISPAGPGSNNPVEMLVQGNEFAATGITSIDFDLVDRLSVIANRFGAATTFGSSITDLLLLANKYGGTKTLSTTSYVDLDNQLRVGAGKNVGFFGAVAAGQQTASANLTDNSGGIANDTVEAIPDPADAPADADALREDLVANAFPAIRNDIAGLTAKVNKALTVLRTMGFMA